MWGVRDAAGYTGIGAHTFGGKAVSQFPPLHKEK